MSAYLRARITAIRLGAVLIGGLLPLLVALVVAADEGPKGTQGVPGRDVGFTAIEGSPLTINVAKDASYQVIHDSVEPSTPGQVYPTQAEEADAGIFAWYNSFVLGPDFANHSDGSAANDYNSWTNTSQSGVTGSGAVGDPWIVNTVVANADSGVTMTTDTAYVNGEDFFRIDWEICLPAAGDVSTFLAADIYLQGSDAGFAYYDAVSGSVGGRNEAMDWFEIFTPITPADHYYEANYFSVWSAIGFAGNPGTGFNDTLEPELVDNGAGLQWDLPGVQCATTSAFWSFGETPTIPPTNVELATFSGQAGLSLAGWLILALLGAVALGLTLLARSRRA